MIHNPSAHHMRRWEWFWDQETKGFWRRCPHMKSHPDPDSRAYSESLGYGWAMEHPCDGCCEAPLDGEIIRAEIQNPRKELES